MQKIILKGYILVSESELEIVKKELINHIKLSKEENGCLAFEVSQDKYNKNRFNVYEEFTNQKTFEAHQVRVRNSKWGLVTINVTRHYQITKK